MRRWNFLMESSWCKSRPVTVEQTGRKRVLPFTGRLVGAKRTQRSDFGPGAANDLHVS
jgi:hypothetical protein